jgi:peroxiredoxin
MTDKLTPDAQVPALSVPTLGGGRWDLAGQTPENFTMIVFYRGYHCPVCKAYLGTLEGLADAYEKAGFSIIAASMDTRERAEKSADEWALSKVTVGYGLTEETARDWGLYLSSAIKDGEADLFCEPGLFWVRPDGRLYLADVSNMPWARPDLEFLHSKIPFAVEKNYPARGTRLS